jgi:ADP-heptose:LPS heptosyltransferase
MTLVKQIEVLAKRLLALVMAVLLRRPRRKERAQALIRAPRNILLVRPDARVGEALLMTPLFTSLRALTPKPRVDVLVHKNVQKVLAGHPDVDNVLPFDRRGLFMGPLAPGVRMLRKQRYDLVVNCGNWEEPSVTSAIVSRLAAPTAAVVGPATHPVDRLHDFPVTPLRGVKSEVAQRLHLLSVISGFSPRPALSYRPGPPGERVERLRQTLKGSRYAVVNPGGRLGWRCAPPMVFNRAVREVASLGFIPVITWGPWEEGLAQSVRNGAPTALVAPQTSLDELAVLMQGASFVVCNNTGPMHLSVALGTPTLALFLHMDIARWGHSAPPHVMEDLTPVATSRTSMEEQVARSVRKMAEQAKPLTAA